MDKPFLIVAGITKNALYRSKPRLLVYASCSNLLQLHASYLIIPCLLKNYFKRSNLEAQKLKKLPVEE